MGAIHALQTAGAALRRNPILFVVTVGGGVLGVFGASFSLLTAPSVPAPTSGVTSVGATPPPTPELFGLPSVGLVGTAELVVGLLLVSSLVGAFFTSYSTAFYRSIRPAQTN